MAGLLSLLPVPGHAVVKGQPVSERDGLRRFAVSIEGDNAPKCSGTLIASDIVLTAGHCVTSGRAAIVIAFDRSGRQVLTAVAARLVHPTFKPDVAPRDQHGTDLALLRLIKPLGADFASIRLADVQPLVADESVVIAGFGMDGPAASARILRSALLAPFQSLQSAARTVEFADPRTRAGTLGAGACHGDSGGPVLQGAPGGYRFVGVISWSSGPAGQRDAWCGGVTAATPLAPHIQWIEAQSRALRDTNATR